MAKRQFRGGSSSRSFSADEPAHLLVADARSNEWTQSTETAVKTQGSTCRPTADAASASARPSSAESGAAPYTGELGGYIDAPIDATAAWYRQRLKNLRLIEVRGHPARRGRWDSRGVIAGRANGTVHNRPGQGQGRR